MGEANSVKVYIYDLSKGLARSMSAAFLGKQIDGVWHTGIVAFGQEFYFGGMGIESCSPGQLPMLGQPDQIVEVGKTEIPFELFMEHLKELATTTFRGSCYHLLDHNCNTFSNEVALFLTGNPIPSHITNLPQEVMSTPLGAMIRPMIDSMQVSPGGTPMFDAPQTELSGPAAAASQQPAAAAASSAVESADMPAENEYFPKTSFLSFDTANIPAILGKVKEFNSTVETDLRVEAGDIEGLQGLIDGSSYHSAKLDTLLKLLTWPDDLLFPVLDVLRLSVRHAEVNQYLCGKKRSPQFIELTLKQLSHDQPSANQMLALRTLCNTFLQILGKSLMSSNYKNILSKIPGCLKNANKNIQIAASSLLLNFAVIFHKSKDYDGMRTCLETCDEVCAILTDTEAYFRMNVCLGTLLSGMGRQGSLDNVSGFVRKCCEVTEPTKVAHCAKYVSKLL